MNVFSIELCSQTQPKSNSIQMASLMNTKRVVTGFLVAPLAPAFMHGLFMGGLPGFLFAAFFSYSATLVLGLPALFAFTQLGWLNLWATLVAGAVLGTIVGCILIIAFSSGLYITSSALLMVAMLSAYGFSASATFWWIAIRDPLNPRPGVTSAP
ncbi:hypothetical protein [Marinimicrobium sp. ABcell2]|uniref:hypothetical protein n=1 Tax=Marinimicrobium sp. ABcell2 TaxID=3069751 RepID=UPI0027B3864B|nr:hypothetical protein [Marinimicrobium sp. ABcell2]MDQ2077755.1 hypothetical protein [Marinimicrobium sp. ABcell2]